MTDQERRDREVAADRELLRELGALAAGRVATRELLGLARAQQPAKPIPYPRAKETQP